MKLLFIGPTYIGDAALSTGLLDHLLRAHPQARVTVAAGADTAPLFAAMPGLERFLPVVKRGKIGHWLDLWRACVGTRWDVVVDLRGSGLAWLLRAGRRCVFRRDPRKQHRSQAWAATLGLEDLPPPVTWTAPEADAVAARLVPPGPAVLALCPTGRLPAKRWPAERFAELARRLVGPDGPLQGGRVMVLAAPGERAIVEPLLSGLPPERTIDFVGRYDLTVVIAALKRAALFVGNDTGPLYIAVGCGIPAVGLFGPTHGLFGPPVGELAAPWAPKLATVRAPEPFETLWSPIEAERKAPGTKMGSLSVESVERTVRDLLQRLARCGGLSERAAKLSALVVARNEERRLGACLACLAFADERVVVLDRTSDRSPEIALAHGARILEGAWEIEGERRNAGIAACAGDWILEVDADELVSPELAAEIRATVSSSTFDRHLIPVDNYIGRRLVRHGWGASFGKSATPGLFRRGTKRWGRGRVHPALEFSGTAGPPLRARLDHYVDRDISDMLRRLDRYTSLRAQDLRETGDPDPSRRYVRRIFTRFFKCYVGRGGWREGGWGLLIALLAGLYPILSHLKAKLESGRLPEDRA
ncbi:MAG: glycosyltransferase family 9 protein [Pseudomonadota bacterium]